MLRLHHLRIPLYSSLTVCICLVGGGGLGAQRVLDIRRPLRSNGQRVVSDTETLIKSFLQMQILQ